VACVWPSFSARTWRAGVKINIVKGVDIAKATGGVHCLTRPLYL
jgi:N-dimethylarginine dimethylaminohydrolase